MKPAPDIVFVFPPAYGNMGAFKSHLGVAYFRAVLKSAGIRSHQYLNDGPGTIASVADDLLSYQPSIVGFTAYDANLVMCLALARRLKRQRPALKIVVGGPTATFGAENLLSRHDVIDYCVRGETEEIGPQTVQALLADAEPQLATLPGLVFRRDGQMVDTGLPALVGCGEKLEGVLDSIPSPYLSEVLTDGRAGVLTGRGCTYHCQYCCFAALGRKRLRLHSAERVLAELEYIARHQKRTGQRYVVSIHDDAFTLQAERAKRLCRMIIDRDLGLVLSCITRADKVDVELLGLMKAAGFIGLAYGLESSVPSVLRATGKVRPPNWQDPDLKPERAFVRKIRHNVKAAKKLGFNVGVSIILGLPTETAKEGLATLRFVRRLPVDYYMHNFLWVFPGTPLWETHGQYGIESTINSLGLPTTVQYAYDVTKLRPRANCSLEHDATMIRLLTADGLFGCEAFDAHADAVTLVTLHADELTPEQADWMGEIMNIGGTLIQVYPPTKRREETLRLYQDRLTFGEHLVPARHHIQVLPRAPREGSEGWTLACSGVDLYSSHKPELLRLQGAEDSQPFLDWASGKPTACDFCEAAPCLVNPDDLEALLNRLNGADLFSRLRQLPVPPRPKYPGRWQAGPAPCASLSRIELDQNDQVRTCRHAPPIGRRGDSLATLRSNLARWVEEVQRRRGCSSCPVVHCPRCPFPGIEDATYCRLMQRFQRGSELLTLVPTLCRFPLMLEGQRDKVGND